MSEPVHQKISHRVEEHGKNQAIEYLCLDKLIIYRFDILAANRIVECMHLEYLTMNDCHLNSLENLPTIPSLLAFEASKNRIPGKDLPIIARSFPKLAALSLQENRIESEKEFSCLIVLKDLRYLEIERNPVSQGESYRENLFEILPDVITIDGQDIFGDSNAAQEVETESQELSEEEDNISNDFETDKNIQEGYELEKCHAHDEDSDFSDGYHDFHDSKPRKHKQL